MSANRSIWARVKGKFAYGRGRRIARPRWLYLLRGETKPISPLVGLDRGDPIDRRFIERFLAANADRIRGDVLEIKDRDYTTRFGGAKVKRSEILDVNRENAAATVFGDIRDLREIADDSFDCFIITQVLQYVDDLDAAVRASKRVIRPGGCLLVTVPTVGKLDGHQDKVAGHFWRLTVDSARYVFAKHFAPEKLDVRGWGNSLVGASFLQGFCAQELSGHKMDEYDPEYACGVTIRAVK
jgi:SAM-dependent methyltransferase